MKYKINMRELTDSDMSRDCPFPTQDRERFEMTLQALSEDIGSLEFVTSSTLSDDSIIIESSLTENKLLEAAKPFFQRDFCIIRYTDIHILA